MTDTAARSKLVDQHIKLKSQLRQLASKMDEILKKQRERKKNKNQVNPVQDDEKVQQLKKQLKQQELRIQKNKQQIARLRKNLDSKYDINKIVDKENELKHLKKQLSALEEQKKSLQKIRQTQDRAIKNNEDKETMQKIQRMEEQLKQLTQKTKKQVQSINEKQKQIRKLHQTYILKQAKVKQIQAKLKQKQKKGGQQEQINEYTISQLQEEIKQLQTQRTNVEKQGNQKIRGLERERKQLKTELDRKKLILQEKEKELRLNQLKHKEIIRLINSNQDNTSAVNSIPAEKQNHQKRKIGKKGRQDPKIQQQTEQVPRQKKGKNKQSYGTAMDDPIDD